MAKDLKFSSALAKLEEIVEKLEGNDVDLDEAMKLLEEGLKIHKSAEEKLKLNQNKIEKIITGEEVN
ncbi:exodeoxyribonuclease VII small subunit [Candidatus Curtissbacteria bacterium RIFCSPLOWO2_01_FULL_39_62]|uniref:Exodeoxyribonuclease 7 small subunit n=2 Tax=Candidatus Curtissiibacteriota TaxID=1752717 RepID=A0A1F5G801_9BACT|nr:MAG: exodeoxyribonuclease VII small subunit [Candidatus Curtissbacteria bacterium RIFCSPHIGHO2_01_FULL_39_57]OGD87988.1 MAG: exodeoxyribonuclease VII small subunit [Candidatus Curtissbacteria bacterium RIFCSPHIGHO2_02_FULL_40_16b]OGD90202.1 MAG: exodeoxyribonuclease VII small subunit [Candidatus Curtissbacteria bacterium RIFCSPHIGHO2_12_FULL_38_37]OGE00778.1 MAG: exodeoxyribonuclease VII small subunit [Candidatus Curtissbacteria bacterium RIFCSPLOWO2_02_FULL_40_11]OGE02297.1 MAG: exodeoxyrib